MKTILLLVRDDSGLNARLFASFDLVRALDAQLVCLDIVEPIAASDPFGGLHSTVTERQCLREASLRRRVEDAILEQRIDVEWIEAIGDTATCLVEAAALSDLIVLGRDNYGAFLPGLDARVIVKSCRPVLVVPDRADEMNLRGQVVIAWDGSSSAIAALRAALPILAQAKAVTLVEIDDGSVAIRAERASEYLGRYSIPSHVAPKHALASPAGHLLAEECRRLRPSYVVMGGYGHSPLREAIFGGATRHMLEHSTCPLLLAHA